MTVEDSPVSEDAIEVPEDLEGAVQVMESWGISGSLKYSEEGSLLLTGPLGYAVVDQNFDPFTEALTAGKSDSGLTYQDMADFNQFSQEFRIEGIRPSVYPFDEHLILIRKLDGAPYGFEVPDYGTEPSWEDDERGSVWEFTPMNPVTIQGYNPA